MAYSIARLGRNYRAPEHYVHKDDLRHQLAMAKYQERREMDWQLEQIKHDAHNVRLLDLQRVRLQIQRNKDFEVAGYAFGIWFAYLFGYFTTLWYFA